MKLTFILFLTSYLLVGQNIEGTILDSQDKRPIENATIYFEKNKVGNISNAKGEFSILLKSKRNEKDTLQFSRIGYHTKKVSIETFRNNNKILLLTRKLESLDEVILKSENELNATLKFKILSSLKSGVFAFGSCLINNKIYVAGGNASRYEDAGKRALIKLGDTQGGSFQDLLRAIRFNSSYEGYSSKLQIYDIENDTWDVSNLKFNKRAHHTINSYNNEIYVLGGKRLSVNRKREYLDNAIEVFNLNKNEIVVDETNPHQAVNATSVTYKDNIIVLGGSIKLKNNREKVYTDKAHIYNLTSGYWFELTEMTKAKEASGVLIKDKIYLIGGFNKVPLTEIESYDLITGKWQKEGDLFYGIENSALTHHENIIYIFNDDKILTYNTITKVLDEYKIDLNLKNSQIHYYKNNLYLIGGIIESEFSRSTSSGLYVINLYEFIKTKINKTKNFN